MRVETTVDEQRVAQPHMRAHGLQAVHDIVAQPRLEQRLVGVSRRVARPRRHLVEQLLAAHALAQPHDFGLVRMRPAHGGQHHHDLVVAHQAVDVIDAVRFFAPRPELQHAGAVGTAVDHVAEIDEATFSLGVVREATDGLEKNGQFGRTAMDIADGEHGFALEIERRGFPGGDVDREGHGQMVSLSRAALHRCRCPPPDFVLCRSSARRSRG